MRGYLLALATIFVPSAWVVAAPPPPASVSKQIDQSLEKRFPESSSPVKPASDAEFLRRVTLDIAGRIPTVGEVREYLADSALDKQTKLVERLLASPGYARQSAQSFRSFLVPQASSNPQLQHLAVSLESWIREEIKADKKYDEIVRDLITTPLDYQSRSPDGPSKATTTVTPIGFFQAGDLKAETVASNVSRMFLGIRIECAQCHDHPFDKWTRMQFWETAAFFAGVLPVEDNDSKSLMMAAPVRQIKIPELNQNARAKLLDGKPVNWTPKSDPRKVFADWMTSKENPFFPRMAVNRIWANYFGVGLVDPIDDFGPHNEASHPELLKLLAESFVESGFDEKYLIRAITGTSAYRRSGKSDSLSQNEPRLYLRMNVKALSPEQLFDSLAQAGGYRDPAPLASQNALGWAANTPRGQLIAKFGGGTSRSDMQTSILQALALMNGDWIAELTDPINGNMLRGLIDSPFHNDASRIDTLFLATLSRMPDAPEKERFVRYVEKSADRKKALSDVFWTLLNSNEFLVNH